MRKFGKDKHFLEEYAPMGATNFLAVAMIGYFQGDISKFGGRNQQAVDHLPCSFPRKTSCRMDTR